jgi:hypothetical protein
MTVSPVLLLIFNRPDTTARVMEAIRGARPQRLYVAADGARNIAGEHEQCKEARCIATAVDWECEVKTLFRDVNLGCRFGVSTAIDWFFSHENEGIILEDDCVPSKSFFVYCDELLERFRHDNRIMCISGANFQQGRAVTPYSYYFSRYPHCWGWASWRRAWRHFDRRIDHWPAYRDSRALESWSDGDPTFVDYWTDTFDRVAAGGIDSWGYIWTLSCWAQHGLTCLPVKNLVTNIGFGANATHTTSATSASNLRREELEFPLLHPQFVARNVEADRFTHVHHCGVRPKSWAAETAQKLAGRTRGMVKKVPGALYFWRFVRGIISPAP